MPSRFPRSPFVGNWVAENYGSRDCPINPHRPQMGSHKAAKWCDRGFAAAFLVTKTHIEMPFSYLLDSQTSPLNVQRIGGVTMAENPVSTRPTLARKPHRYKVDEGLDVRFLCHANSTHVLQTLWRGLDSLSRILSE